MRLIDKDALPIVTRGKNHHRKYVFADITDAPTIEAIPVEWLEHLREKEMDDLMMNVYGRGDSDACHAVCVVLDLWQKEQEART